MSEYAVYRLKISISLKNSKEINMDIYFSNKEEDLNELNNIQNIKNDLDNFINFNLLQISHRSEMVSIRCSDISSTSYKEEFVRYLD